MNRYCVFFLMIRVMLCLIIHNIKNRSQFFNFRQWYIINKRPRVTTLRIKFRARHHCFHQSLDSADISLITNNINSVTFAKQILKLQGSADTSDFTMIQNSELITQQFSFFHSVRSHYHGGFSFQSLNEIPYLFPTDRIHACSRFIH